MHGSPVHQKSGAKIVIILQNLKFVPNLLVNLFSISKALKNGFNLGNEDFVMKLMKEDTILYFHRLLKTKNRFVSDMNSLIRDYKLQLIRMEKRINDKQNLLAIDELM